MLNVKNVSLHDYRNFKQQGITLDPKMTVITGQGKTTALDAIVAPLINIRYRLRQACGVARTLEWDDIRYNKESAMLTSTVNLKDKDYKWTLCSVRRKGTRAGEVNRRNYQYNNVHHICADVLAHLNDTGRLPVFSLFYPWVKPVENYYRPTVAVNINQIQTYEMAMTKKESKTQFFQLMSTLSKHIYTEHNKEDCPKCKIYNELCELIVRFVPFIETFEIHRHQHTHDIKKTDGVRCNYAMLSGHEFRTLHFVGDLLYRVFIANSCRVDADAFGVVLLDDADAVLTEVGVLIALQEFFPNIQFVVSTDKPELFTGHIIDLNKKVKPEYYYGDSLYENPDEVRNW